MKKSTFILSILFVFSAINFVAQEIIYFDANWTITDKVNATYYRPSPKKTANGFWLIDYYSNGNKQMEGLSLSDIPNEEKYEGKVIYFFKNGKKQQEVLYLDGKPKGRFSEYYETGELKKRGKYSGGFREGIWKSYYKNGKIEAKGKYRKGEKVGIWKIFYKNDY